MEEAIIRGMFTGVTLSLFGAFFVWALYKFYKDGIHGWQEWPSITLEDTNFESWLDRKIERAIERKGK